MGDQIAVISSEKQKKGGGLTHQLSDSSRLASVGWHADITFERVPSDYAMLKIHTLPVTGGDTVGDKPPFVSTSDSQHQLWASGYEIYDRLSSSVATLLEGLTATHDAKFFLEEAARLGNPLRSGIRGSPLNHGSELQAVHPVIRTNRTSIIRVPLATGLTGALAVTGWKSVFVNKGFTKRINGVTKDESDLLLGYLFNVCFLPAMPRKMQGGVLILGNLAASDAKPRRAGPTEVEQKRPGYLGQQIQLALRDL